MIYGVYQVSPSECERCVSDALEVGYRMIDTAQALFAAMQERRYSHGCCVEPGE